MADCAKNSADEDELLQHSQPVTTLSGTVAEPLNGLRIDQAVAGLFKDISRERAKKFIAIGAVWLNGVRTQIVSRTVRSGDTYCSLYRPPGG